MNLKLHRSLLLHGGPEHDGGGGEGEAQDEGLDTLGEDRVAAVEHKDVHKAGQGEEEVHCCQSDICDIAQLWIILPL